MSIHRLKKVWQLERSLTRVNAALSIGDPLALVQASECDTESELGDLARVRVTWAKIHRAHYIREIQSALNPS